MIKEYEFIGKQCAVLRISYFGIDMKLEFTNGNTARSKGAEYTTKDRFTQDAIEHDMRFGKTIVLKNCYPDPNEEITTIKDAGAPKSPAANKGGKGGKGGKGNKNEDIKVLIVEECKTMNDVIEYFKSLGENPEGDEDIKELMEKYGVVFPEVCMPKV